MNQYTPFTRSFNYIQKTHYFNKNLLLKHQRMKKSLINYKYFKSFEVAMQMFYLITNYTLINNFRNLI